MIELLMVILLVGILVAAATPQLLDFRDDARKASIAQMLGAMRVGIALAQKQFIVRCGAPSTAVLRQRNLLYNSITLAGWSTDYDYCFQGDCSTGGGFCPVGAIPTGENRLWSGLARAEDGAWKSRLPVNPYGIDLSNADRVTPLLISSCTDGKCSCDDIPGYIKTNRESWVYFANQAQISAGTNVSGECDI